MAARRKKVPDRLRVGRVSVYFHHAAWWVYYREGTKPVRRRIGEDCDAAERIAAQINAQLANNAPSLLSFRPIEVADLRDQFLQHHEHILKSSIATIRRYRSATQHLIEFAASRSRTPRAHEVQAEAFVLYLRTVEIAPNGHPNANKRWLRDKGVQFILETCRALYGYAGKRRHLPPYAPNPIAELPIDRMKIDDAKPIFVFDENSEFEFLRRADRWAFSVHFVLAKTGLRPGELIHLLIDDIDLSGRWLRVSNKAALGWSVKTRDERMVPLLPEVAEVLRTVKGDRDTGVLFLRRRFAAGDQLPLMGDRRDMERVCAERRSAVPSTRDQEASIARTVWRDAGALKADSIRASFIRLARTAGIPHATCPKSWRHSFATLLQDANVDPLVRQITLGHRPASRGGLGMTAHYTHTRPETQREQVEAALRRWSRSLVLARHHCMEAEHGS